MLTDLFTHRKTNQTVPSTTSKEVQLQTNPHYTDRRFDKEQTVFGRLSKSPHGHSHLEYVYSDRLWQWDYGKAEKATKAANESDATLRSCRWYEVYLSAYFDKPVTIEHILAGVNASSGYPYYVCGYTS